MNMNRTKRLLTLLVVVLGVFALAGAGFTAPKANHHDGKQLLGDKIKDNGHHELHKNGKYTVGVEVKNGKVAGVNVKGPKGEDLPVKKYKSNKNMAMGEMIGNQRASFLLVQDQYLGTVWIGFAYYDEYGNEEIYWFPYDMILDGITGAIDYVPAS
jgi:hypothetical protein